MPDVPDWITVQSGCFGPNLHFLSPRNMDISTFLKRSLSRADLSSNLTKPVRQDTIWRQGSKLDRVQIRYLDGGEAKTRQEARAILLHLNCTSSRMALGWAARISRGCKIASDPPAGQGPSILYCIYLATCQNRRLLSLRNLVGINNNKRDNITPFLSLKTLKETTEWFLAHKWSVHDPKVLWKHHWLDTCMFREI